MKKKQYHVDFKKMVVAKGNWIPRWYYEWLES